MVFIAKFFEKIVVSGNVTEVWRYEHLNVNSGGARERTGKNDAHNYANTQKMRRNTIRQLVCTNFDVKYSKFVTLTFDNLRDFDITDVKACYAYFKNFIKRLQYRYKGFLYLAVVEFQDKRGRGAVHYHMICNLPYIKKSELQKLWGAGFVKINVIDKVDNIGAYVVKYMTKDTDDKRLCGLKAYYHSRDLEQPVEVTNWRVPDVDVFASVSELIKSKTPVYSAKYTSENAGVIEYLQFNDTRNK